MVTGTKDNAPEFRIDEEDLEKISEEESGRAYLLSDRYQLSADRFAEMALYDDDVDGDGYSTVDGYLEYLKVLGRNQADLPSFILEFIQENYRYVSDSEQYGWIDWYAYPIETIASGEGDCEDFAILSAALLHRLGYGCGILVFKNHALTVVALDPDDIDDECVEDGYSLFTYEHDGRTYYAFETSDTCPLGYASSEYTVEDMKGSSFF